MLVICDTVVPSPGTAQGTERPQVAVKTDKMKNDLEEATQKAGETAAKTAEMEADLVKEKPSSCDWPGRIVYSACTWLRHAARTPEQGSD